MMRYVNLTVRTRAYTVIGVPPRERQRTNIIFELNTHQAMTGNTPSHLETYPRSSQFGQVASNDDGDLSPEHWDTLVDSAWC
jgi:hypothetical protein